MSDIAAARHIEVVEGFDAPKEYEIETLIRLNRFCRFLRTLLLPSQDNIKQATTLAKEIDDEELASAAIKRHLKQFAYAREDSKISVSEQEPTEAEINHQRALWYVLDSLVKDSTTHFKFFFQEDIIGLIEDSMPYKIPTESKKYKMLMDSWIGVFDATYLLRITEFQQKWVSEIEFGASLPEEEVGRPAKRRALDFSPPCHEYLQGQCFDDQCPFQHPLGEEGSLPAEAKPGDWQCTFCATINRHFRRRCTFCPTEKTQYYGRGDGEQSNITFRNEVSLFPPVIPTNDPRFDCLRAQFGYDFMDEEEAKRYWDSYFEMTDIDQWEYDRSLFYRMRILKRPPQNDEEEEIAGTIHYPDIEAIDTHAEESNTSGVWKIREQRSEDTSSKNQGKVAPAALFQQKLNLASEQASKDTVALPSVPAMAPPSQIAWIHKTLKETGAKGKKFSGYLCQFFLAIKKGVIEEKSFRHIKWLGVIIIDVFRAVFHSFIAFKKSFVESMAKNAESEETKEDSEFHPLLAAKRIFATFDSFHALHHPAHPFCSDLRKMLKLIPIPSESVWELEEGSKYILEKSEVTKENPMEHFDSYCPKIGLPSDGLLHGAV